MSGTTKKGKYSTKQTPCRICGNTTGSCKHNHDGSIYCYHSDLHSAPSGYVHIRELSDRMGQEFIEPFVVDELLRAATFLQGQGKKASTREMADLTGLPSSWARAVQESFRTQFPSGNDPSHPNYYPTGTQSPKEGNSPHARCLTAQALEKKRTIGQRSQ